jgi:ABC-type nitrate/sulfonate/bicarbonate transport system permease component
MMGRQSGVPGFWRRHQRAWLGMASVAVFFLLWETIVRIGLIRPIFVSSPSRILQAAVWLAGHGLWQDMAVSGTEFALGIVLAMALGLPAGILLGWYERLRALFDPFVVALYSTPRVALLPLLILWLGIGIKSKIAVVFLGAVFPILVSTKAGVESIDDSLLRCARSFGANYRQIFRMLALPSSVPFIISGLRLGVGRGLVGVVVGEFIASTAGIGHMMNISAATFQTDQTFVGILILAAAGMLLSWILDLLGRRFERWRLERP